MEIWHPHPFLRVFYFSVVFIRWHRTVSDLLGLL